MNTHLPPANYDKLGSSNYANIKLERAIMKVGEDIKPYKYLLDLKTLTKLSEDELLDKALMDWKNFKENMNQEIADEILSSDDPLKSQSRLKKVSSHLFKTETGYGIRGYYLEELWYYTRRALWNGKIWRGGSIMFTSKEGLDQYWSRKYTANYSNMNLKEVMDELHDVAIHIDVDAWGEFGINDWSNFLSNNLDIFLRIQELKKRK